MSRRVLYAFLLACAAFAHAAATSTAAHAYGTRTDRVLTSGSISTSVGFGDVDVYFLYARPSLARRVAITLQDLSDPRTVDEGMPCVFGPFFVAGRLNLRETLRPPYSKRGETTRPPVVKRPVLRPSVSYRVDISNPGCSLGGPYPYRLTVRPASALTTRACYRSVVGRARAVARYRAALGAYRRARTWRNRGRLAAARRAGLAAGRTQARAC